MKIDIKLAAMILIIAENSPVNRTSLNKLLFFADLYHYLHTSKQISETAYYKLQFGPVPENIDLVREFLIKNDFLVQREFVNSIIEYTYKTAQNKVNMEAVRSALKDNELNSLEKVLSYLRSFTATELSNLSHKYEPWKSAEWFSELDFKKSKEDSGLKQFIEEISKL